MIGKKNSGESMTFAFINNVQSSMKCKLLKTVNEFCISVD